MKKAFSVLFLAFALCLVLAGCGGKTGAENVDKTASYLVDKVTDPTYGSVGGEWTVFGLARSNYGVPDGYFDGYYDNVVKYVKSVNGVLSDSKYTEYSRLILALTAIGKDPGDVGGYNLLTPLGDYDKTISQGLNGPIWALIALDSGNYEIPTNVDAATPATRDMYLEKILAAQLSDGGFSFSGGDGASADPDMTAMALCALANYTDRGEVKTAVDKAVDCLSSIQKDDGGFASYGDENTESDAQVLTAMAALNINVDDSRFVKNGKNVEDNLLTFRLDDGSFCHLLSLGTADSMATEQAFCAVVALERQQAGESGLYNVAADSGE